MSERSGARVEGRRAGEPRRNVYRRRHRLSGGRAYRAVFNAKLRKSEGPLTVFARPNGLDHPRLGLSIGRRVGNAVTRNRLKRLLRDAFRLEMTAWAERGMGSYDLVISVRPHRPLDLEEYRRLLTSLVEHTHRTVRKREARRGGRGGSGGRGGHGGPGGSRGSRGSGGGRGKEAGDGSTGGGQRGSDHA